MNDFVDTDKGISIADLDNVELRLGFTFPVEFRKHYIQYNGGCPSKYLFDKAGSILVINRFLSIKHGELRLEESFAVLHVDRAILPKHLVPFAVDAGGDYFCFSTRSEDCGSIWLFNGEYSMDPARSTEFVANSLTDFIEGMFAE